MHVCAVCVHVYSVCVHVHTLPSLARGPAWVRVGPVSTPRSCGSEGRGAHQGRAQVWESGHDLPSERRSAESHLEARRPFRPLSSRLGPASPRPALGQRLGCSATRPQQTQLQVTSAHRHRSTGDRLPRHVNGASVAKGGVCPKTQSHGHGLGAGGRPQGNLWAQAAWLQGKALAGATPSRPAG